MTLIATSHVSVELGGHRVLHDIDFSIGCGEIVVVVGPNGSGKSTFVRMLIGALDVAQGTVTRQRGLSIGYVPQKLALDATLPMTVGRFLNLPRSRNRENPADVLAQVGAADLADRQMSALSGGQFQRVLLARALINAPDILILDEPTQGLDHQGTAGFYDVIAAVRARLGCAVLMVSHDLHVVMRAADRVICLNGHVCCQGTPTTVAEAPEYLALFGEATAAALAVYRHHHDHSHEHDLHRQPAEAAE